MRKTFTILAASALVLGAAACSKSENSANTSAGDNMLVPADDNAMSGDMNATADSNMAGDNSMAMDNAAGGDNMMSNSSNAQ
ncbi:hypothetical protein [Sphingomonas morindae]|uniref:Circumsporozoite protein n=1 Tax=Sphingomonas morindae TaxID=1541170 RepID=A0ABY4X4M7_9SPHN|nr:hypothetical protein [Sphingomonas morindae]USI71839.1 hypothetical protein LHA26_10960 [Sphingomonas morindae]